MIEIFGYDIPLWAICIIGIIAVVIMWKLIKFALILLLVLIIAFVIVTFVDSLNIIGWIQGLLG